MVEFNRQERIDQGQDRLLRPGGRREDHQPEGPLRPRAARAARGVRVGELAAGPHDPVRPAAAQVRRVPRARPALPARGGARPGDLRAGAARGAARVRRGRVRRQLGDRPLPREPCRPTASCRGTCSRSSSTRPRSRWCCSTTSGTCPTCWRSRRSTAGSTRGGCPVFQAVATRGEGVLETFAAIIRLTLEDLSRRYPAIALPEGQTIARLDASRRSSRCSARRSSPSGESDEEVVTVDLPEDALFGDESSARHLLKLAMPEEARRTAASAPDARVERRCWPSPTPRPRPSSGCGSTTCARSATSRARGSPSCSSRSSSPSRRPRRGEVEDRAQRILTILMRSAEAANASLLLTTTDPPQIMVLPPLVTDPLARTRLGRPAPARAARPGGGAARGRAASCPRSARRSARPSPPSSRWRSCRCARPSACWPSPSSTTGRT